MKVLIDNGHGENTKGKRSPDGKLREYAWTREIADMLVLELGKMGIDRLWPYEDGTGRCSDCYAVFR